MGAHAKEGNPAGVERTFERMKHVGVVPNVASYNMWIRAHTKAGDPRGETEISEGVERVLDLMSKDETVGAPDEKTFRALFNYYLNNGQQERARQLLDLMKEALL
ncbi:unnamed protein product [Amoebophrya sp. A120]|nr:unnamed protein product [Amoebophrya sp. A120]|eukprot:GSA120T00020379001.1